MLQQRMRFDYYLSNKYKIADISGANLPEKKSLSALHRDNDVIVLTAQILVDALSQKRIAITDFSLLIFDECHHTQKGHPYNDIMSKYLAVKFLPVRSERGGFVKMGVLKRITANVDVNMDAEVEVDVDIHTDVYLDSDLDMNVDIDIDKDIDIDIDIDIDEDININIDR